MYVSVSIYICALQKKKIELNLFLSLPSTTESGKTGKMELIQLLYV